MQSCSTQNGMQINMNRLMKKLCGYFEKEKDAEK
jgi:hypothetical protein